MTDTEQPEEPQGFGPVPPGPLPTTVGWEATMSSAGPLVSVTFSTPAGVSVFFLPPMVARQLAAGLEASAEAGEQAIVPKPAGIITPDVDVSAVLASLKNGNRK